MIQMKSLLSGPIKFYPNLNPSLAFPVDREQIFTLHEFFEQFRLRRGKQHGHLVPNWKYVFVRLHSGEMLLHPTLRHPTIAEGKPVLYAGEAFFDNGKLEWWSNGSGNYRPDPAHAAQAGLPMNTFYTYSDVLKGAHKTPEAVRRRNSIENQTGALRPGAAPYW